MRYAAVGATVPFVFRGAPAGVGASIVLGLRRLSDDSLVATSGVSEQDAGGSYPNYTGYKAIPSAALGEIFQGEFNYAGENFADEEQVQINLTGLVEAPISNGPAYATVYHVQALNAARPITGTSRPSATQVAGFLTETAAVIDAILSGRGFELPIATTATGALKLLEGYNAKLAWPLVERSAPVSPHQDAADKAASHAEKMLLSMEPPQVPRDPATTQARTGGTGSPIFSRDMTL